MVGPSGLEPPTSCLSGTRSNHLSYEPLCTSFFKGSFGGDDGIRTHDPLLAGQVLSQLSYTPIFVSFAIDVNLQLNEVDLRSNDVSFAKFGFLLFSVLKDPSKLNNELYKFQNPLV